MRKQWQSIFIEMLVASVDYLLLKEGFPELHDIIARLRLFRDPFPHSLRHLPRHQTRKNRLPFRYHRPPIVDYILSTGRQHAALNLLFLN